MKECIFALFLTFYFFNHFLFVWYLRCNFNQRTYVFLLFWKFISYYLKLQWFLTFFIFSSSGIPFRHSVESLKLFLWSLASMASVAVANLCFRYTAEFILFLSQACLLEFLPFLFHFFPSVLYVEVISVLDYFSTPLL